MTFAFEKQNNNNYNSFRIKLIQSAINLAVCVPACVCLSVCLSVFVGHYASANCCQFKLN